MQECIGPGYVSCCYNNIVLIYGHEHVKKWRKRWSNKDILLKMNMSTEIKKKGGGYSLPLLPVEWGRKKESTDLWSITGCLV